MSDGFSIQVLAQRTGLTSNVLRTWENRFGFPKAERTASGHRRFTDHDVTLVQEVLKARETGVPLQLAIDAVLSQQRHAGEESVHAVMLREIPALAHHRLTREALVATSHAIEDETLARAGENCLVLGAFQEGHRFAQVQHRWDELARTAAWCAVLADFDDNAGSELRSDPHAWPARCQLPERSAMRREWTVVTLGPGFSAVLSAWEVPSAPGQTPTFEAVISTQPAAVVVAARVITAVADSAGASPPADVRRLLTSATPRTPSSADADRIWVRALANLDRARV